jgi:hypothetical protein
LKWTAITLGAIVALSGMIRPAAAVGPSYSKDIKPFLTRYCAECHNDKQAKAGVNLDSYQALMKGDKKGRALIVPKQPDTSRLLHTMEGKGKVMPPRKAKVRPTAAEVAKIRAWIRAGALDDTKKSTKLAPSDRLFRVPPVRFLVAEAVLWSRRESES